MTQTKYLQRSISVLALMLFSISTTIAQSVVANIPLGRTPTSLAVNPVTNRVYVASMMVKRIASGSWDLPVAHDW